MLFYSDKARETATERTSEIIKKLAELKPTESFRNDDIAAAIMYLNRFKEELKNEMGK